jgi:hypothetical protein
MKKITLVILNSALLILHSFAQPNIQWQNTIGGTGGDALSFIQQTDDGGYILGRSSSSNISGDKTENSKGNSDYWIVKNRCLSKHPVAKNNWGRYHGFFFFHSANF